MKRYQNWILAGLSGILLVLSHPNFTKFNLFPLAWIALVPLLISLKSISNWKSAFWLGYITGLIFFFGLVYWIALLYPYANIFVMTLGYVALVGYIAVYVGVFAGLLHWLPWRSGLLFIFIAASIWTGLEWVRGWLLTGFPWGSMGYTQWNNLTAIQMASITGVHGVSFVIVLFNAAIADLIFIYSDWQRSVKATALPITIVIGSFVYGAFCLSNSEEATDSIKIALVPGNVRQIEKWNPNHFPRIFDKYIRLTEKANTANPDLIVWPETTLRGSILSDQVNPNIRQYSQRLKQMLDKHQIHLLTGVVNLSPADNAYYNSAFLLSPAGKKLGSYSKIHLVPFGEYVPLSRYLPNLIQFKPYEPGKSIKLLPFPNTKNTQIGISICFESVFPNLFRKAVKKGANVMGILTNDAWFENTAAPEQHLAVAPLRAVENRVPVFRCANGGISCIIDSFGRVITTRILPDDTQNFLVEEVPLNHQKKTFYTRYGDWFPILCFLVSLALIGYQSRIWVAAKLNRQAQLR